MHNSVEGVDLLICFSGSMNTGPQVQVAWDQKIKKSNVPS